MEQKKIPCNKVLPKKCGDKEAPVVTFFANAFLPLDTAALYGPLRTIHELKTNLFF